MATRWCLQHVDHEGPGAIAEVVAAQNDELRVVPLFDGAPVPSVDEVVGPDGDGSLIVMGGPMGALDDPEHPYLAAERDLIAACVAHAVPVLGVCLAAALGADVRRGPRGEVGGGVVTLTAAAREDAVFAAAPDPLPVVHWHHDTFDLPSGAVLLASSDRYVHQAFRAGPHAYGLQFHVELGPRDLPMLQERMNPERVPSAEHLAEVARVGRPLLECLLAPSR